MSDENGVQKRAREAANAQRNEAKQILLRLFGISEGESNGAVERVVDCIIGAVVLESAMMLDEALKGLPHE